MIDEICNMFDGYYNKYPNTYKNMDTYINEDPWQEHKGYGKDKFTVSYLERIEGKLTNLIFLQN